MNIINDKYDGKKLKASIQSYSADVIIHGYLEGQEYHRDRNILFGISMNSRANFTEEQWEHFKQKIDSIIREVKRNR